MLFTDADNHFMQRALFLAAKGRFTTSPNPNVGCVIVKDEMIIGEGFHQKAGTAHAEVHALAMAGKQAENAICYVTLEPCAHFGRTGPCALALVKAGVKRVIVAMVDPNPKVAGGGIRILQEAGIQVDVGLLTAEAESLNLGFITRMKLQRPRVTVKMAASLDGKTALKNGQSKWITGAAARADVQYYRAQQSAILTGNQTVFADDPSLNVRYQELLTSSDFDQAVMSESELRQPIRIILDSHNKLTLNEKLFDLPGKVLIISTVERNISVFAEKKALIEQIIVPANSNNQIDLQALLIALNAHEINDLWVEAGATLAGEFFKEDLVDEFILYQAPKLLGDQGRNLVKLPEFSTMNDIVNLNLHSVVKIGDDIRLINHRE
ncbi:bifunctional diaminohydroxyphosphoribosylaminopyrimidine deaminase/5-amino-6-(5-phosphoribosylamino)uracil reductase RibD [Psychromonas sp. 14N.309.X.WAT.B.A12]|uniref:bifunctional diaminohydroxyphosphoribosylaminopyrimidine deaminase/5-amino-6-(5-phosphoribosylamino)uracil reductase RibD n=1 Tax=Psychromonas sp. 14N.309.X.WAT.B.A12 TaxID=2998322 RepID=UPI0025AF68C0|nr:bifunctional diaminohydroxyphosphoribosylaminopyrimidine deaminase/5-amino-6-(5-phosphoribosylamino)uracil reductase RibD [Psychromonas sp. 14N.309.X.WAT.B.A12]MDN2663032.1 bifunctional diaminohydroxyphosphoribosylaminopyrimidine deaminase/5-amino-6-(5-phosphoribosylamino)uracil reductase RibD [Psychromonas sp. 14N.309.X.WAT.B.A12]